MKTTLIQIEPHDDLTSIKDKMTWAKSTRMLLFFPHGYPQDQSPLTMKLIRRYAEANGSRVALITRDRVMREIALEQGIPCFSSAPQAEKKSWGTFYQTKPLGTIKGADKIAEQKSVTPLKIKSNQFVISQKLITIILFLSVGGVLCLYFVPSAHVILYPVQTNQSLEYQIFVDPEATTVDITGNIPAIALSIEVSGELAGSSSGKVIVPKSKATGEISITNQTNRSVNIPQGTIVSTTGLSPIEFYLKEALTLDPPSGTAVVAPIEAVVPGETGNVESGLITIIGGLENIVAIMNPQPTSGGTEQSFSTPTKNDYKELNEKLRTQLLSTCKEEIAAKTQEGIIVIENSIKLGQETSRNEIPAVGEPSDRATLSIKVSCAALGYSLENEKLLAKMILDENILNGLMPLNDIIQIKHDSEIILLDDGRFTWEEGASRVLMQEMNTQSLSKLLSGKSKDKARDLLFQAFDQIKSPEISIKPAWWSSMPLLPTKINITMGSN